MDAIACVKRKSKKVGQNIEYGSALLCGLAEEETEVAAPPPLVSSL